MSGVTEASAEHRPGRITLPVVLVLLGAAIVMPVVADQVLVATGHHQRSGLGPADWMYMVGVVATAAVGAAVARDQPRHPVGWLFLALAGVLALAGDFEAYL